MREIDFRFDFRLTMGSRVRRPVSGRCGFSLRAQALANQIGFVIFQRTGVRFLLGDTHFRQHVKNFLALDLQLAGQIIDSNLHPFSLSSSCRPV
jgi:hypothetical protein